MLKEILVRLLVQSQGMVVMVQDKLNSPKAKLFIFVLVVCPRVGVVAITEVAMDLITMAITEVAALHIWLKQTEACYPVIITTSQKYIL